MNWTKIPTNLLISRTPDNELVAIVKYQLLWADLEYQPTDEIALRYMTNKQLASVKHYLNDIEAQVVSDIKSTVSHRGNQKMFYKKKQSLKQNADSQCDSQCDDKSDNHTDGADKIRLDIEKNTKKSKFNEDSIIYVNGQYFDEFPPESISLLKKHWSADEIENMRKELTCKPDHQTTVAQLLLEYPPKPKTTRFVKPTIEEIKAYCEERKNSIDAKYFYDHYEGIGWKVGKNPMKDWKAVIRTWEKRDYNKPQQPQKKNWSNYTGEGSFLKDAKDDPFLADIYNKKD